MTAPADQENPLALRPTPICGHIRHTEHYEWICIKPPHMAVYQRRRDVHPTPGNPAAAVRHYFVNRWPYRPARPEQ